MSDSVVDWCFVFFVFIVYNVENGHFEPFVVCLVWVYAFCFECKRSRVQTLKQTSLCWLIG